VRCDDLLRQNGADTARLAASSRLCKALFAGDGAGEAATQLGRTAGRTTIDPRACSRRTKAGDEHRGTF